MSRDSKPVEKVDTVATVETRDERSQKQALAVDAAEQLRKIALERRSQSVVHGSSGPVSELGHKKYVPPGFKAEYVNPASDKCQRMYDRGWDFVRDAKGEICYLTANNDRNANEHRFPYMMAPLEIYVEEMRESARLSRERLAQGVSDPNLPVTSRMRNDPFFHDIGLSEDDI